MNDAVAAISAARVTAAAASACTNCGTPLAGRYCHACGQDTVPSETAWRSWRDQWAKLLRTLAALVLRPGLLTREHLDGGRVRYVAPLTLYLNAVAIFFLCSALFDFRLTSVISAEQFAPFSDLISSRAAGLSLTPAAFLERADRRFQTIYTLCLSAISVAGYALIARVLFRRRWHDWRGPITFALHFMAFVFIVYMPLAAMSARLTRIHDPLWRTVGIVGFEAAALLNGLWFTLAIRRLFADRWSWAIAKGVTILLLGIPFNTLMLEASVYLTLRTS